MIETLRVLLKSLLIMLFSQKEVNSNTIFNQYQDILDCFSARFKFRCW